jgi:hypothetical protein
VFKPLAEKHCGTGLMMNVLVVHNTQTYGGAGRNNFGTTSLNEKSPTVAVHEIGHSLFGLADEYSIGRGKPPAPNCEPSGCSDWSDLMGDKFGAKCVPACAGGNSFTSGITIMQQFHPKGLSFGVVNERITCCKFLFHGHIPPYCTRFNEDGLDLRAYCTKDVWQGKTPVRLDLVEEGSEAHMMARAEDPVGATTVYVREPVEWIVLRRDGKLECTESTTSAQPGLYPTEDVRGEYGNAKYDDGTHITNAEPDVDDILVSVYTTDQTNVIRKLFFHSKDEVEVPPFSEDGSLQDASKPRNSLRVILNRGEKCTARVA